MQGPHTWEFRDPNSGFLYTAPTKKELLEYIVSYRTQNELPAIEFLPVVVENYMCRIKANMHLCEKRVMRRGIMQYLQGGLYMFKSMFSGKFVSQEEADRRSEVCKECPLNFFPTNEAEKSKLIAWSDNLAESNIGSKKSAHHEALGNCEACSCTLRLKVWVEPPFKLASNELVKIRAANKSCWQLPENANTHRVDVS